jgi:hypothetical protein
MSETVIGDLEAARATLAPAGDNARTIAGNPAAQADPAAVADAWLAADAGLEAALRLLDDGGGAGTVVDELEAALAALDAADAAAVRLGADPNAGAGPKRVAASLLDARPSIEAAAELVGESGPPDAIEEPGEELPPVEADPDLSGMTAYQPEPGTPGELTAALNALSGKPACGDTYIRCKGSLALTGTYVISQQGHADGPLIVTAPAATVGEREPGPKPSLKHVKITGSNVWLHGFAAELPPSDIMPAVLIADGSQDVRVTRCWLDAPCGVHVDAAVRFDVFANDFYGAAADWCSQFSARVMKSGPLPEDGRVGRNYFSQLKDIGAGAEGACCYTGDGVQNPSGDKARPFDRNMRSTVFYENYVRSQRKYLVYHKHAMTVLRNKLVSVAKHSDHEGTGNAYHVLASRGGNWCGGRWAYNVLRAGPNAHCDVQGWDGVVEHNDFGGCIVNIWAGMDQADGKSLLGANGWSFVDNEGGKYQVGTTRDGTYWLAWPLEDVTWEGEVGASWRWEGAAPDGSSYQPSGGPEVPWGADGTNSQKLVYREGGADKVAVAVGALRRVDETGARAGMPLAHDLDEGNTGLAYRG